MKHLLLTSLLLLVLQFASAQVVDQDVPRNARDQVIADDLIVQGSECVGLDCNNGENFGFSTIVLKENNVRLKFFDTSNSGSFPSTDWELEANSSANGGTNHFAIKDVTANRTPFKVMGNAPNNSLFVSAEGRLGIKTATPVVNIHVAEGNTPTLRLQQDGSSGFTPQIWDVAGNEANFFIRDVSSGSRLPFKIKPGAPTGSIYVAADGDLGIGTESPIADLHVKGDASSDNTVLKVEGVGTVLSRFESSDGGAVQFRLTSDDQNRRFVAENNSGVVQNKITMLDGGVVNFESDAAGVFTRITAGSNGLTASSSRELKSDISKLEIPNILERISEVPVTTYHWKSALVGPEIAKREVVGLIAQEFYPVLERGVDTEINGQDVQMALWMGVQELHKNDQEVETLIEEKDERIQTLEEQVLDLTMRLDEITELLKSNNQGILLNGGERPSLGQNYPNPYGDETAIEYFIPQNVKSAEIVFTDMAGKLIKKSSISNFGKGVFNLRTHDLAQGNYQYSLVVDGIVTETKQMTFSR